MNLITESIKAKYPAYSGLDDDDLTLKIAEKFPVYLKQADFAEDVQRVQTHRTSSMQPATGMTPGALTEIPPEKPREQAEVEGAKERISQPAPEALAMHQRLTQPLIKPQPDIAKFYAVLPPKAAAIAAGSAEAVADAVGFLESPYGIGTIALTALPGAAGKIVMTAMAADMLANAPGSFMEGVKAARSGDTQEATRHFVTAGIVAAGGTLLGVKGVREMGPARAAVASAGRLENLQDLFQSYADRPQVQQAWQRMALMPLTSEAVAEALRPKPGAPMLEAPKAKEPLIKGVRIEYPPEEGLRSQRMAEVEARIARGRQEIEAARISGDEGAMQNLKVELTALERERQGLPPEYRPEVAPRREEIELPTAEERIYGRSLQKTPFSETTYRLPPSEEALPEAMQAKRVPLKTADDARAARLGVLYDTLGAEKARAATLEGAQRMGADKAEIARDALDKLLEVEREKVPLSAAERTIFDQIWDAELEKRLVQEQALAKASTETPEKILKEPSLPSTEQAARLMGEEKAKLTRQTADELLQVTREKVPLTAAERTIFEQVWAAALEKKLAEERAMGGATVKPPPKPPPEPPPTKPPPTKPTAPSAPAAPAAAQAEVSRVARPGEAPGLVSGTPADQWAQRTIREGLGGASANPFADPRFIAAAVVRGAALLESGVRTFAEWGNRMAGELGEEVRPHLSRLWEQSHNYQISLKTLAMGGEGWFHSQVRGLVEGAKERGTQLWMGMKEFTNRELPVMAAASPEVAEKAVAYASARPAAKRLAARFWDKVFADKPDADRVHFHAALIQDRLDGKQAEVQAQAAKARAEGDADATDNWDIIASGIGDFVGTEGFPFKTREELNAYLAEPATRELVGRYATLREQEIEPLFQKAAQVEPGEVTPVRGLQTGAFISLVPLTEERPVRPIYATGTGNLKATLQRPPRHARRFTGLAEGYELDPDTAIADVYADLYQKATYNDLIETMINNGLGTINNRRPPSVAGESPSQAFPLKYAVRFKGGGGLRQQDFYVPRSLGGEFRKIVNVDKFPAVTHGVNTVLNQVALASLSEFTSHMSNLTSLFTLPGKTGGSLWADTLAKATFADVPVKLVQSIVRAFRIGKFEDRLIELTKMGATREHWDASYGRRQVPGLKWTQKAIAIYDDAITTMLDESFDMLAKEGRVEDTPANRRAFINQRGQYNLLLQDELRRLFRKTGFGPFVTAGTAFHIRSLRSTPAGGFSAGVSAVGAANDLALRLNVASRWVGVAAVASGLTYLFTGSWMPRKGVPIGAIDSGKNDERGNPLYFDLANWSGIRRGLRVDGIDAFVQAKRLGLPNTDAFNAMARQAINAWISPFAGPPIRTLSIALTGRPLGMELPSQVGPVPPGRSRAAAQIGAAVREANPIVATIAGAMQGEPLAQTAQRQLTKFAPQSGVQERRAERMPRIVHGAQLNQYIDELVSQARRLPMHQRFAYVIERVRKDELEAKDRPRIYQETRRRLMRP